MQGGEILVFLLVLGSCVFQAVWYVLVKSSAKTMTVLLSNVFGGIMFLPLWCFVGKDLGALKNIWYLVIFSGVCNGIVFWLIANMFRQGGDVSFITPLRQGFYLLASAFISIILGVIVGHKARITGFAFLGYVLIALGCFFLPVLNFRELRLKDYVNKITLLCIVTGFFAAASAALDSNSLKILGDGMTSFQKACLFTSPFRFATCLGILPFLYFDKIKYVVDFTKDKADIRQAFIIGFSVTFAYILVCCAYPLAKDVSYVVAYRLMAMPLTMLGGIMVYKEPVYAGKIVGTALIILGLVLVSFL